ncbi:transcriptional regulator, TetR family [Actinacidiphila yanglinensis]|uniref:Transcriptional regulator, TetR family n=1 Tax=Actinacidiphila yanglinensis TaxID=310779 RepID=A0A1H6BBV3_9ACTN|nr:TetR/AcrR family transcriptional regulator [Actinacidiphila yanglinensis]SEG58228.1 transcriptional regulator, TetR family [Actinacidiphila yanglinensis]
MPATSTGAAGGARRPGTRSRGAGGAATSAAPRQRQRERSDATVEDLLTAARALFATDGYGATSLDAVCERAGVTKGALYHHFTGKRELFSGVYAREQEALAAAISAAYLKVADRPWEALFEGSRAYLEASIDPEVQRITLFDAPGALGWEAMRTLGFDCRELTFRGVARAIRKGAIPARPADPLTSMLYGGLSESAMAIARAEDPQAALAETLDELRRLFDAIAGS